MNENKLFKIYLENYKYELNELKKIIELIDKFKNLDKENILNYFFDNSIEIIKNNKYNKIENPFHFWNNLNIFKFILFDYDLNKNKNTKEILNIFNYINIFEENEKDFYDYFKGINLKEIFNENFDNFICVIFNNINNFEELNNCYVLFNKNKKLINLFNERLLKLLKNKFNYYDNDKIKTIMIKIFNENNNNFKKEFFEIIIENGNLNKILDFFILFLKDENNFVFKDDYINQIKEFLKQKIINFNEIEINKLKNNIEKNIYFEILENFVIDENDFYDKNSEKLKLLEIVIKNNNYFNDYNYRNILKKHMKFYKKLKKI